MSGTLGVAHGGTGATTAAGARANLGTLGSKLANSYEGMTNMAGADNVWIRTTSQGIIPYQSGGAGSGHGGLGTSSWYFATAYIDNIYGKLNGDITGNAATATSAGKLSAADKGSTTNPIYFSSGVPAACTYNLKATLNDATQWGVAYYSTTTNVTSTGAGTSGYLLQGNGSAAPSWIQATNSNTASTIVKRDGSGNFSAGTITAALSGNASTATKTGVAAIWLYPEQNNEINFGGTNTSTTIYFGYRAKDSRPIPTKFVFGNSTGTADLQAKTVYLGSGTTSYISSTQYTGNAATATTATSATSATNADTVDSYHLGIAGYYRFVKDVKITTNAEFYVTITFDRGYVPSLNKMRFTAAYDNINGEVYLDKDSYHTLWNAYVTNYNSCNIVGIAMAYNSPSLKGYLKLRKPNASGEYTVHYEGTHEATSMTASTTAPSGVTFTDVICGQNYNVPIKSTSTITASSFTGNLTGNVTGNATSATSATSAGKLSAADKGSTTNPIYFSSGVPAACTYELKATLNNATQWGVGYYSTTTNVTSTGAGTAGQYLIAGGTAAPSWVGYLMAQEATPTLTAGNHPNLTKGRGYLYNNALIFTNSGIVGDQGWVKLFGTTENDTVLEIATGDNGNAANNNASREEIAVRQYGADNAMKREIKLFNKNGDTVHYNPLRLNNSTANTNSLFLDSTQNNTVYNYAKLYISALGTAGNGTANGTAGATYLLLGNNIARSTTDGAGLGNAAGYIRLYDTGTNYLQIAYDGGWSNKDLTVVSSTSATENTAAYSYIYIGNNKNVSSTSAHSEGRIRIYSAATSYHQIAGTSTTSAYTHYLPNSTGWVVTAGNGTSTGAGSSTQPIYISTAGVATAITGAIANNTTGNAATATKLATARKINGTDFDGSAAITTSSWGTARNVTVQDSDGTNSATAVSVDGSAAITLKLPATIKASITGNVSGSSGSCTGNAATATSATKATQDGDGNVIKDTYIKKSVGTTAGDLLYFSAANTPARLAKGSNGQVLMVNSSGNLSWGTVSTSDTKVTNTLNTTSKFYITGTTSATTNTGTQIFDTGVYVDTTAGKLVATTVYGAVWNDYAEYREVPQEVEAGRCVKENGKGQLIQTMARLEPAANIVSDTFGFAIGETDKAKTAIAVCGRVLAYPYESKATYAPGDAVCSGPNGTVSKMSREEIINYPDRIVGTVSEIPTYETWGTGNVPVKNRIWIKIK